MRRIIAVVFLFASTDEATSATTSHESLKAARLLRRQRRSCRRRRGFSAQMPRREIGMLLRRQALAIARLLRRRRVPNYIAAAADILHIAPQTLRNWYNAWHEHRFSIITPRGRPPNRSPVILRNEILATLDRLGGGIGFPTLRSLFPDFPFNELRELLSRYKRVRKKLRRRCTWLIPGTVWATDHTRAKGPTIEGGAKFLLPIRDLATGYILAVIPTASENAAPVAAVLRELFEKHGAPLIFKTDNGSAFIAAEVKEVLSDYGVIPLLSPPRTPRYNGAIEACNGKIKQRIQSLAEAEGHPHHWTIDNIEAARRQHNALSYPFGPNRPTPVEAWTKRPRISNVIRRALQLSVNMHQVEAEQNLEANAQSPPLTRQTYARLRRTVVTRAACEHGILQVRSHRFSPHNLSRFSPNIPR